MVASGYVFSVFFLMTFHLQYKVLALPPCQGENELTKGNKTLEFTVKGHRNQTGHWITQFMLNQESEQAHKTWKVDVKHSSNQIGGINLLHIKGALIVPPPKPSDYELFPGVGYYKFHYGIKVPFQEASSICFKEGGHLAIINSAEESNVIKTIYARNIKAGGPWSFIGFYDRNAARDFVTIFGQPLNTTGFLSWHPGEPNNIGGNQFCGCAISDGLLADVGCDDKLSFFCEYDLSWSDL